jgi:hypothetical protein
MKVVIFKARLEENFAREVYNHRGANWDHLDRALQALDAGVDKVSGHYAYITAPAAKTDALQDFLQKDPVVAKLVKGLEVTNAHEEGQRYVFGPARKSAHRQAFAQAAKPVFSAEPVTRENPNLPSSVKITVRPDFHKTFLQAGVQTANGYYFSKLLDSFGAIEEVKGNEITISTPAPVAAEMLANYFVNDPALAKYIEKVELVHERPRGGKPGGAAPKPSAPEF